MKILYTLFILLVSNNAYSCCSSPLLSNVYKGELLEVKEFKENNTLIYEATFKRIENIYGEAPGIFTTRIRDFNPEIGESYVVALYDEGKHKNDWLLPKEKWGPKSLALNWYFGANKIGSLKANIINKNLITTGNVKWSNSFKYAYNGFYRHSLAFEPDWEQKLDRH